MRKDLSFISIIQPIDEGVADYIRLQIREGCKTPKDIQCRVAYFVKENIFGGLRVKEAQRNKIIPSRKKIQRYSKIDQDKYRTFERTVDEIW